MSISVQGSPAGLARLVRGFQKKPRESDEDARRFFRRIFGILWVNFDFNLIFPSGLIKKRYRSFQFSGNILRALMSTQYAMLASSLMCSKFHVYASKKKKEIVKYRQINVTL